ncbi:MAG: hypothetical protein R3E95_08365 [Thiolinea sp.]
MRPPRTGLRAGRLVVELAKRYYEQDDHSVLPRAIANKAAFTNAMALTSPWAVPPTPCCTCWPLPRKARWISRSPTLTP